MKSRSKTAPNLHWSVFILLPPPPHLTALRLEPLAPRGRAQHLRLHLAVRRFAHRRPAWSLISLIFVSTLSTKERKMLLPVNLTESHLRT